MPSVKVQAFDVPPYDWEGLVVIAATGDEFVAYCRQRFDVEIAGDPNSAGRTVFIAPQEVWVLWVKTREDVLALAHECFHVVSTVLRGRGLSLEDASEEAFCYALTGLMRDILACRKWDTVRLKGLTRSDSSC